MIEIPGPPRGKGAPRATILPANPAKGRMSARAAVYQDGSTRSYEAIVRYAAERAMAGRPVFQGPLRLRVTAVLPIPASKSKKWQAEARGGVVRPEVKPDDDNVLKVRDAMKHIVFRDDAQFCETVVRKFYGEHPCLRFEIWRHSSLLL